MKPKDTEGNIYKVAIEFSNYQNLLEIIEDNALYKAMMQVKEENPLSLDEVLAELEKE